GVRTRLLPARRARRWIDCVSHCSRMEHAHGTENIGRDGLPLVRGLSSSYSSSSSSSNSHIRRTDVANRGVFATPKSIVGGKRRKKIRGTEDEDDDDDEYENDKQRLSSGSSLARLLFLSRRLRC